MALADGFVASAACVEKGTESRGADAAAVSPVAVKGRLKVVRQGTLLSKILQRGKEEGDDVFVTIDRLANMSVYGTEGNHRTMRMRLSLVDAELIPGPSKASFRFNVSQDGTCSPRGTVDENCEALTSKVSPSKVSSIIFSCGTSRRCAYWLAAITTLMGRLRGGAGLRRTANDWWTFTRKLMPFSVLEGTLLGYGGLATVRACRPRRKTWLHFVRQWDVSPDASRVDVDEFMRESDDGCDLHHPGKSTGGCMYAIKQAKVHLGRREGESFRTSSNGLLNEMIILRSLQANRHECVPEMYDSFVEPHGGTAIVMEALTGGELLERVQKLKVFSEGDARSVVRQLISVIQHLHSRGIIHGDIKAENVLYVNPNSKKIKLIDFNCSRTVNDSATDSVPSSPFSSRTTEARSPCGSRERRASTSAIEPPSTEGNTTTARRMNLAGHKRSKSLVGTPAYFSPEILSEHESGKTSDMWAIGCLVCLLLSGSLPFTEENTLDRERAILHTEIDFAADEHWNPLSYGAKHFTKSLLQKDPLIRLKADQSHEHFWLSNLPIAISIRPSNPVRRDVAGPVEEAPSPLTVRIAKTLPSSDVALSSPRRLRKYKQKEINDRMESANAVMREKDESIISEHVKTSYQIDLTRSE